ncbi:CDP-alcohol phosphatidyltransferase family protein [Parablautia sp. Marseille-Q6255]|uniref:CDP-alcohol phosphatidyltransferase family protein n=1 Tax=Parablautia sp. Marseille-Q6255 TaxID=3039593 RepID=UPI0024BD4DE8|nr:CDP-alcohol phosphatidyltransferase family protein [Parablautia sp. Marseille-Q6255]
MNHKKLTHKEIFSIPNLMSYLRILLIPVFCYLYVTAETRKDIWIVAAIVLFSSLTDLLDGFVARHFHMITELGKVLDPVADKLTHAALAFCLAYRYPLMWALIILMAVKEGYMAFMGLYFLKKGEMLDGAMWFGKICTTILFIGMLILFLGFHLPPIFTNGLIVIMMVVMGITLCLYIPVFRKMKQKE